VTPARAGVGPDWLLLLPLGAFFALFFAAPLVVLLLVSLSDGLALGHFDLAQYAKFLGDAFSLSILVDTLVLGVKATAVCLLFGLPLAWVCVHAGPRLRGLLLFLVIMPILTSVVVRTFAWIVILGRQGIMNKTLLALGFIDEPLRLLFSETGVVMVLAQVQMPLMVLPLLTTLQRIDPKLGDASAALGAGAWRTFRRAAAQHARHRRGLDPGLRRLHDRLRDADTHRRRAARLHAALHLPAGDGRQQLALRRGDVGRADGLGAARRLPLEPARARTAAEPWLGRGTRAPAPTLARARRTEREGARPGGRRSISTP
jgi:ABC-type spermidine/putrescine transport system permease subunit II